MATFIKAKLKKSDVQTNNDEYRVSTNIIEIIFFKINFPRNHYFKIHDDKTIISLSF